MAKKKDLIYPGGYYTMADLNDAISRVDQVKADYQTNKQHNLDWLQLIEARENYAYENSRLLDIGADILGYKLTLEKSYRQKFLEAKEKWEEFFWADEDGNRAVNPKTKKPWTDIENRARYKAEQECMPDMDEIILAKKLYARVQAYEATSQDILHAMAGRIRFVESLAPKAIDPVFDEKEAQKAIPIAQRFRQQADDGFGQIEAGRYTDPLDFRLND